MVVPPELERLVVVDELSGCWLWTGSWHRTHRQPWLCRRSFHGPARRYVWLVVFGELPVGQLMRRCGSPRCVSPEHAELVMPKACGTESGYRWGGCRCKRCIAARHLADTTRDRLKGVSPRRMAERLCVVCGGQLPPPKQGKPRLYCSVRCSTTASRARKRAA